jgi:RNA polymerase sigma factor (sigma-70 family)
MTDEQRPLLDDPIIRRLQQAFAHEEPTTELAAVLYRAADYLAVDRPGAAPHTAAHSLTAADLVAARQREPAAVTRLYTAYAPSLFRFFAAAVSNRQEAQDLTGSVFVSAIEALPGFRGPVEALGGWLFRIARHDLYDFRRKQGRPASLPTGETDIQPLLHALQAVVDRPNATPPAALPQLVRRLHDISSRTTDAPLNRLSPREREVLELLGRGWSNAQIGRELRLSPHTVRAQVENLLVKLEMHTRIEAATSAMGHDWSPELEDPDELSMEQFAGSHMIAAARQLPPDQREVLLLHMAAGLTAPEVAAALHKTSGAVKALQHRALANLARILRRPSLEHSDATAAPKPPHTDLDLHAAAPQPTHPEREPPTHGDCA